MKLEIQLKKVGDLYYLVKIIDSVALDVWDLKIESILVNIGGLWLGDDDVEVELTEAINGYKASQIFKEFMDKINKSIKVI